MTDIGRLRTIVDTYFEIPFFPTTIVAAPGGHNSDIHDRLTQACVWLNLLEEAANAADRKLAQVAPDPQSFLRAASIHARLERREKAAQILRTGLSIFPHVERLQRCFMELAGAQSKIAS